MIRPFQLGDTLLLQRLQRQAPKLNVAQSLLQPRNPAWSALTAGNLWNHAKVATYVLHQNGHGLARSGFLQAQRRPGRPESDILVLAPALETRTGHPAIWEKLLAHCVVEATQQGIARLYADVPDQPLLVNTFAHVGFGAYARRTLWRLTADDVAGMHALPQPRRSAHVRLAQRSDEWELLRLYARVTPKAVQSAEGVLTDSVMRPPIFDWWLGGDVQTLVSGDGNGAAEALDGCLRVVTTRNGVWMQLWADARSSDITATQALLAAGLKIAQDQRRRRPIYMPVRDYQGGLGPQLSDLGFAPFADHAQVVKHLLQRVVETESIRQQSREHVPEVVVTAGGYTPPSSGQGQNPKKRQSLLRHRSLVTLSDSGSHALLRRREQRGGAKRP